jgi:hypothetical protein
MRFGFGTRDRSGWVRPQSTLSRQMERPKNGGAEIGRTAGPRPALVGRGDGTYRPTCLGVSDVQ